MAIGQRISGILHERGISQNKLAKMAGLSQSGMSSILSGASSPREDTLQAIAKALGIPLAELMDDSGTKKEPATVGGLDDRLVKMLVSLSPDQVQRVQDFVAGMKSSETT